MSLQEQQLTMENHVDHSRKGKTSTKEILLPLYMFNNHSSRLGSSIYLGYKKTLNAFYRKIRLNRCELPTQLISSSDINFIGPERELRELVDALDKTKMNPLPKKVSNGILIYLLYPKRVKRFNSKRINDKAAKRAIIAVLRNVSRTDEKLITAVSGA